MKIDVYPDIEWSINFNINDPLYYRNTEGMLKYYDKARPKKKEQSLAVFSSDDMSGNIRRKRNKAAGKMITSELSTSEGKNRSQFQLHAECSYNGGETAKLTGDFAEKFRSMLAPLLWIKQKLDGDLGVSEAKQAEARLKKTGKRGLLKRLNKLPMSFELTPPNIGVGVGIGYAATSGAQVGHELSGRLYHESDHRRRRDTGRAGPGQ